MIRETRRRFHDELAFLQTEVHVMGDLAIDRVTRATGALLRREEGEARAVIEGDDELDERYLDIERRILDLLALQTPVATDLRLVFTILHITLHLERVGDMAVNMSKIGLRTRNLPTDETILRHLEEMADVVGRMLRQAMDAFARRDLELCLQLPAMDDPVDMLNRGMWRQVVALAGDPAALEWGIHMNVVARQLERVGDHAVDIGEQVGFLLTGEFREFTDASHDVDAE
jgi:phosphate transport system protein